MKTVYSFLFAGFVLLLLGCKGHIKTITVSAKDGGVTFVKTSSQGKIDITPQRHQQYLTKSDNLTIEVTGLTPNQTATIKATQSYQAITSEPQLKNPLSDLPATSSTEPTEGVDQDEENASEDVDTTEQNVVAKREKVAQFNKENRTFLDNPSTPENVKTKMDYDKMRKDLAKDELMLDKKIRKRDSLLVLQRFNEGNQLYSKYYHYFFSAVSEIELDTLVKALNKKIDTLYFNIDKTKVADFSNLSKKYNNLQIELNELRNRMVNYSFTQKLEIFPYKERVDITVDLNTTKVSAKSGSTENTPVTSRIYTGEFITRRSFKMLVSAGFHTLISDGANVRNFANHDSTIVDRKGINVVPSFGTYLHATWRVQDALIGFGLGTGIPFSSDSGNDLTPNFSLFGTTMFQTDAGRMGFNIGVGLRKVNYLSPGYSVGDAISSDVTVIPTYGRWRPTLMVGVSYTIPEKEAN